MIIQDIHEPLEIKSSLEKVKRKRKKLTRREKIGA